MRSLLIALIGVTLSAGVFAQDFLQQWHDSATRNMSEMRAAHKPAIEAAGWRFVSGAQSVEGVPISDLFVKGVKVEKDTVRSANLLNVFYVPVPASDFPEYQSTKMLVWFDCKEGEYEQRILERYATVDGSGNPVSRDAEKQGAGTIEMPGADRHSYEKALLAAVCQAKR
ncbi:MAG: surface-adhesin E family protein [Betaproteobacteria bacterium]|jgi:hypothetical protein